MPNPSDSLVPLFGRALICWIFIYSAWGQIVEFQFWSNRATQAGLPFGHVAIAASITVQMLGGIAILAGLQTRCAAWALFVFLIPTTLTFHQFWKLSGAAAAPQINNFNRNMAIMGGLLFVATFGAGTYSIDALLKARRS